MSTTFPIFGLLNNSRHWVIFGITFSLLFYINYYLMANLVGERDLMCVMGAGLTPFNLFFAFIMSVMAGFLVVGVVQNSKNRATSQVKVGSTSFLGLGLGTLTSFCTLCSLPALTLFGSSVSLGFFTDYEIYFKILSMLLLGLGLHFVNKELKEGCNRCAA